jgi:hypothetical protein
MERTLSIIYLNIYSYKDKIKLNKYKKHNKFKKQFKFRKNNNNNHNNNSNN